MLARLPRGAGEEPLQHGLVWPAGLVCQQPDHNDTAGSRRDALGSTGAIWLGGSPAVALSVGFPPDPAAALAPPLAVQPQRECLWFDLSSMAKVSLWSCPGWLMTELGTDELEVGSVCPYSIPWLQVCSWVHLQMWIMISPLYVHILCSRISEVSAFGISNSLKPYW